MTIVTATVTDTVKTTVTDTVEALAADRRAEIASILALGLLRRQAEHAGVVGKRMRTPEPRSQLPPVTPLLAERYDLLSPGSIRPYAGQTGRPARRGAGAGDGAQRAPFPAAAKAADTEQGASR
ncbi:MAG: hypothetical protein IT452_04270 [Planctomycetia bacterium]|nr:hypothetical protein [Planctomycetia bacterium]